MAAHTTAVENLVLFAPLVIILHLLGISSGLTITAACSISPRAGARGHLWRGGSRCFAP